MNTEDQQDRIDAYLRGSSTDPAAFERELQHNPQLKEDMEATRLALDAITVGEDQRLKERLRKLEAGMAAQVGAEPKGAKIVQLKPRKKNKGLGLVAAAAVVLLVAGYFIFRPATTNGAQLAMETFTPEDNIAYTITKSGNDTDPRAAAYLAYEAGNYAAAEKAFQPLAASDPIDEFYLGQTLLAQQGYAEALPLYTRLAERSDFNLTEESAYYRALSLIGLDRVEEARLALERIATDANHEKYTEAQRLLDSL